MIPKTIHYCWFGGKPLPKSVKKYMQTWKKHLPDYEIVEWNEDTFDVNSVPFTKEAYAHQKYAFVSDYVRLYALYHQGGIYFDTDVEVLKSFDDLLEAPAFMGYDSMNYLGTAVMASSPHNVLFCEFLAHYNQMKYSTDSLQPNNVVLSEMLSHKGVTLNNTFCNLNDLIYIYPIDYLIVQTYEDFKMYLTENSYSIHHYEATWFPWIGRMRLKMLKCIGQRGRDFYHGLAHAIKRK